jgi:hypothetical protein
MTIVAITTMPNIFCCMMIWTDCSSASNGQSRREEVEREKEEKDRLDVESSQYHKQLLATTATNRTPRASLSGGSDDSNSPHHHSKTGDHPPTVFDKLFVERTASNVSLK